MQYTIQSKYEIGNEVVNTLTRTKGKILKSELIFEFGRYAIHYLVEHDNETRTWAYEYNLEEVK